MRELFLTVLNMSLTAGFVIIVVTVVRLPLHRAPKVLSYMLWGVVLFRLLCPVVPESALSLVPSEQPIPLENVESRKFTVHSGLPAVDHPVNDYLSDHYYEGVTVAANAKADWLARAAVVWLCGMAVLASYTVVSLLALGRKLARAAPVTGEPQVWLTDHIPSPFVLGVLRPRIYLPSVLPREEWDYILLHERTHIRRGDHLFRTLAWMALIIHWFNPLVWLAFSLAGEDMEMSCDEAVLRCMGPGIRAEYSSSLLRLSTAASIPKGPLAFGGSDPKRRIQNVLNYKKPAPWVLVAALIAVLAAGTALATSRVPGPVKLGDYDNNKVNQGSLAVEGEGLPIEQPIEMWFGSGAGAWRTILILEPDGSFRGEYTDSDMGDRGESYPSGTQYICRFHGRFGDITRASAASFSMALQELSIDTRHAVGEDWIEDGIRYISSEPHGLIGLYDKALKPGARFFFYTPEATGYAPGTELYGLEEFWNWWPQRHAWHSASDTLGCYGLRNVEMEFGFFS